MIEAGRLIGDEMAARKADPLTPYRVIRHKSNGYLYAATCETIVREDGKKTRRYTHWGALADGNRFVPNLRFMTLDASERKKLIFPDDWDLSEISSLMSQREERLEYFDPNTVENKFYGDIWLLHKIAEDIGLVRDLMVTFYYNAEVVSDILSLAACHCIIDTTFSRLHVWQRSLKLPTSDELTQEQIERLLRYVRPEQLEEFFRHRASRQSPGPCIACVSSDGSKQDDFCEDVFGSHGNTRVVIVYSPTGEPIYQHEYKDVSEADMVSAMVGELTKLGITDCTMVFDHIDELDCDLAELMSFGLPFLIGMPSDTEPMLSYLSKVAWDEDRMPQNMHYSSPEKLWHVQWPMAENESDYTAHDGHVSDMSNLVCDVLLSMTERITRITNTMVAIKDERKWLESLIEDNDPLLRYTRLNSQLNYHRVLYKDEEGKSIVCGLEELSEKTTYPIRRLALVWPWHTMPKVTLLTT